MASQPAGDELLTPGGVAALLFVDRKTVSRWAQMGKLPFIRTPGGHRRYLRSDVMAVMAGSYLRHGFDGFPSQRASEPPAEVLDLGADPGTQAAAVVAEAVAIALEAEAAEAAEAVVLIATAVTAAAEKAAQAAARAAGARAFAADEAAQTVAREAERTAMRVQIRAEVAAARVATAAKLAVDAVIAAGGDGANARKVLLDASAQSTAQATAHETRRAAAVVATAVAAAAAHVAQMNSAAQEAYENEVTRTAEELQHLTTETAERWAVEPRAGATGVAMAAREAAAALHASASLE